jgi:Sulfotransferase family
MTTGTAKEFASGLTKSRTLSSEKVRQPSILILSMPRGGSSWVGDMLSTAPDALYLREPVTQSDPAINRRVVFKPDAFPDLEPSFERLADLAFAGLPVFADKVVRMPERWASPERESRRLVIKEVNPLACEWFVRRYQPRVIFLLRHPAATAWSARKQGWLGPSVADWARRGENTGMVWREAQAALKDYPDHVVVCHESLCINPLSGFRKLYDFADLTWNESVDETVSTWSQDSLKTIGAWRTEAPADCVAALRDEYLRCDLEWYRADTAW